MDDTQLLQRAGLAQRAGRPAFDLVVSKLRRPPTRPGTVPRSSLIERLARDDSRPIVSVVAPAGYGKTTLLAQWAERNGQAFAWVSVDGADNDPKVLLTYVAEALDAVQPVGGRVFDALASPASSVPGSVVPRLGRAGQEDIYVTPLVCALQARVALHRGDMTAVRRELVAAQRLRPSLTYAYPYFAVQARIELTRVHLALADLAGPGR